MTPSAWDVWDAASKERRAEILVAAGCKEHTDIWLGLQWSEMPEWSRLSVILGVAMPYMKRESFSRA